MPRSRSGVQGKVYDTPHDGDAVVSSGNFPLDPKDGEDERDTLIGWYSDQFHMVFSMLQGNPPATDSPGGPGAFSGQFPCLPSLDGDAPSLLSYSDARGLEPVLGTAALEAHQQGVPPGSVQLPIPQQFLTSASAMSHLHQLEASLNLHRTRRPGGGVTAGGPAATTYIPVLGIAKSALQYMDPSLLQAFDSDPMPTDADHGAGGGRLGGSTKAEVSEGESATSSVVPTGKPSAPLSLSALSRRLTVLAHRIRAAIDQAIFANQLHFLSSSLCLSKQELLKIFGRCASYLRSQLCLSDDSVARGSNPSTAGSQLSSSSLSPSPSPRPSSSLPSPSPPLSSSRSLSTDSFLQSPPSQPPRVFSASFQGWYSAVQNFMQGHLLGEARGVLRDSLRAAQDYLTSQPSFMGALSQGISSNPLTHKPLNTAAIALSHDLPAGSRLCDYLRAIYESTMPNLPFPRPGAVAVQPLKNHLDNHTLPRVHHVCRDPRIYLSDQGRKHMLLLGHVFPSQLAKCSPLGAIRSKPKLLTPSDRAQLRTDRSDSATGLGISSPLATARSHFQHLLGHSSCLSSNSRILDAMVWLHLWDGLDRLAAQNSPLNPIFQEFYSYFEALRAELEHLEGELTGTARSSEAFGKGPVPSARRRRPAPSTKSRSPNASAVPPCSQEGARSTSTPEFIRRWRNAQAAKVNRTRSKYLQVYLSYLSLFWGFSQFLLESLARDQRALILLLSRELKSARATLVWLHSTGAEPPVITPQDYPGPEFSDSGPEHTSLTDDLPERWTAIPVADRVRFARHLLNSALPLILLSLPSSPDIC